MFKLRKGNLISVLAGLSVGGGIIWNRNHQSTVKGSPFDHSISRKIIFQNNKKLNFDITLFQFQTCPFCCKLRAYLDYKGISYKLIEVNSVTKKQLGWSEYRKVPILVLGDTKEHIQLNDSSVIISILESFMLKNETDLKSIKQYKDYYPSFIFEDDKGKEKDDFRNKYNIMYEKSEGNETKIELEVKWRRWVDNELVHMLSPNIYRTLSESFSAFEYFSKVGEWEKNFSTFERYMVVYVGAIAMYFIGKLIKRRYHLDDDVRASLYQCARKWTVYLGKRTFAGGKEPNLSDLSVFGVLQSIEGCAAFSDLMNENKKLNEWFYKMKECCLLKNRSIVTSEA